jgi:hypothetical protein
MATLHGWTWDEMEDIDTELSRVLLRTDNWVYGNLSPRIKQRSEWDE